MHHHLHLVGAVDPVRRSFVSMFVMGMVTRVDSRKQAGLFAITYFLCPLLFLLAVTLHIVGVLSTDGIWGAFAGAVICGSAIYAFLLCEDCTTTKNCIKEIYKLHPEMKQSLARTAEGEWADPDIQKETRRLTKDDAVTLH